MANEGVFSAHRISKKGEIKMIKRIKKLVVVLLLIVTSVFSFGCWKKDDSFKYKFFSQEALDWHWISDMPTLPDGEDVRCGGGKRNTSFYCTLEENTYREYIEIYLLNTYKQFQYILYMCSPLRCNKMMYYVSHLHIVHLLRQVKSAYRISNANLMLLERKIYI